MHEKRECNKGNSEMQYGYDELMWMGCQDGVTWEAATVMDLCTAMRIGIDRKSDRCVEMEQSTGMSILRHNSIDAN